MSKRYNSWQKATALVPLALLSGAWTASLAMSSANASGDAPGKLPDGTMVPTEAIEAPASVSSPGEIAPGIPSGTAAQVVSTASTNGIPAAALAAYQRASQVIATADPGCNLDWTLIAAIGRVESDHGRYGGNVLTDQGVSSPGIFGIPLDGTNGTVKITDTDAGQFDKDAIYDRAIGPMQFIPSTWSVVGVDGDGDGKRDPQDIDDAALSTAVYLCSGKEDLSTDEGVSSAVYRYNHSDEYVALVKSIAAAYASGDYTAVPTSTYAAPYFGSSYDDSVFNYGTRGDFKYDSSSKGGTKAGSKTPSTSQPAATPTSPSGGSTPGGTGNIEEPGKAAVDAGQKVGGGVTAAAATVQQLVTVCTDALVAEFGSAPQEALDKCVAELTGKTLPQAQAAVTDVVTGLTDLVNSLLGGLLGGLLPKP